MNDQAHQRQCEHCGEQFIPASNNHTRQRCCNKPECRKARARHSHQRWLSKEENHDYFKGLANVVHVQVYREEQRKKALQTPTTNQSPAQSSSLKTPDLPAGLPARSRREHRLLQDFARRNPFIIGLLAEKLGTTLQDVVLQELDRLLTKGRAVLAEPAAIPPNNNQPKKYNEH